MAAPTLYYIWPHTNIRTSGFAWQASGSGTAEFYLDDGAGAFPTGTATNRLPTDEPPDVEENGSSMTAGTAGSLTAGQWDWADNDSLGFSTIYVRLADDADPDSKADGFVTSGGKNTGSGTSVATAYKTTEYSLATGITRDTSNGDQVNVRDTAADTLSTTLSLGTYAATATSAAPIVLRGFTLVANDLGQGHINGGGNKIIDANAFDSFYTSDMKYSNGSTSTGIINLDNNAKFFRCEFADTATTGSTVNVDTDVDAVAYGCYFHNLGGRGIRCVVAIDNLFVDETNVLTDYAINVAASPSNCHNNVIHLTGNGSGILSSGIAAISHNSIFAEGSTGTGISSSTDEAIINNLIEGFSGAGGDGIISAGIFGLNGNALYNNTTNYSATTELDLFSLVALDNETLSVSPFTDPINDDFTPVATGNVKGGALPATPFGLATQNYNRNKGAVQEAVAVATAPFFVRGSNSLIGR